MDSDNDSGNSNDGPIHRRRTQGTRPPQPTSHQNNSMQRISTSSTNVDRTYHPTKDDGPYSDDDDLDEDDEDEDDQRHQQSTYRGRGRPSQQQHLMDSSYDDGNDQHDLPRYTGPLREQDRCVSEFISFVTSEASDRCLQEKRKTINGEDIILAMLTLGFDSYVEPLRTFLTKVRDASKYDRTMTMGGELSDDLRIQVAQAQVNQTSGPMVQAQVATTVQVQPQATGAAVSLSGQAIAAKPTGATANPNGLEPYGHSVRVVTCIRNDQPGENPNYVYTIQPYQ
ncbi:unnamed protein product [Rotaria magnacalcarata]|uniref:Nuclear transcription factor Y subunit beta n=1 Tax=Rotaria magnacalcarata TaxID=392030 RepID=A0A8S2IMA2_9BILA|nr:unnamed protein product [Rotaria magnacalcarata]CAF3801751.1 unnamed protein product [Rotaria magnacalcarata]